LKQQILKNSHDHNPTATKPNPCKGLKLLAFDPQIQDLACNETKSLQGIETSLRFALEGVVAAATKPNPCKGLKQVSGGLRSWATACNETKSLQGIETGCQLGANQSS
jgi:hypothetical protein